MRPLRSRLQHLHRHSLFFPSLLSSLLPSLTHNLSSLCLVSHTHTHTHKHTVSPPQLSVFVCVSVSVSLSHTHTNTRSHALYKTHSSVSCNAHNTQHTHTHTRAFSPHTIGRGSECRTHLFPLLALGSSEERSIS